MPNSRVIKGSDPVPAAATMTSNPAQCGAADCINFVGCFIDAGRDTLVGRAVPRPAIQYIWDTNHGKNEKWKPLTCAARAKLEGGSIFGIKVHS